jgi:hypothetical protein
VGATTQPLVDPPPSAPLPFTAAQAATPAPSVTPPPTPVAEPTPASGSWSQVPSGRRPPLELASLRAQQTPRQQREPWVIMAVLGGALLIAIVLAMVAKPSAPASMGEPASPGDGANVTAPSPEPPTPAEATAAPQGTTETASTTTVTELKPQAPAQPSGSAPGAAHPSPRRSGKKKPF